MHSSENVKIDADNLVRCFWNCESVSDKRVIIHLVAMHYTNGRLKNIERASIAIEVTQENAG